MANITVRIATSADMGTVAEMNKEVFEDGLTKRKFASWVKQEGRLTVVAEVENEIVGFMIYDMTDHKIEIVRVCAAAFRRRQGVGKTLVEWLFAKLSRERLTRISVKVPERKLETQLFFRQLGFEATRIIKSEEDGDDIYVMVHAVKADVKKSNEEDEE